MQGLFVIPWSILLSVLSAVGLPGQFHQCKVEFWIDKLLRESGVPNVTVVLCGTKCLARFSPSYLGYLTWLRYS